MCDDVELLRRYAVENSEEAFTELVQQHLGLVHHAALRWLGGDVHGSQEVAQRVFTDLGRKAPTLLQRPLLASWLHTSTRYAALQYRRDERRRLAREQATANFMQIVSDDATHSPDWERLRPFIDQALQALKPVEREAVLLRYFEGRDYAAIGARLHLTQDGVRSRVERALSKMQARLAMRGVVSTAAALGGVLSANAAGAVPPGAATGVARTALDAAAAGGVAAGLSMLTLMKASLLLLGVSLAANAGFAIALIPGPAAAATAPPISRRVPVVSRPEGSKSISPVESMSDPEIIGRRLRSLGYSDQVVTAAVNAAVVLQDQLAKRDEIAAREARVRRWNPTPRDSIAVAPVAGLRPAPSKPFEDPALASQREKALAGLGLGDNGQPLDSLYRGIPADKARVIRKIESDYNEMRLASQESTLGPDAASRMKLLNVEFERDVLAALSTEEQINWLRFSSNAARVLQKVLAGQAVSDQTYAALADASVAAEREAWAAGRYPAEELYRTYRRELGDDRFLAAARNLSVGERFAIVDELYVQAGLPSATRADRYLQLFGFYAARLPLEADRSDEARQARTVLTAGLSPEQTALFDASTVGQALRSLMKATATPTEGAR